MKTLFPNYLIFLLGSVIFIKGFGLIADNLVPDSQFTKTDFTLLPPKTWRGYEIEAPGKVTLNKTQKAVTMTGGITYLHSARFKVEPGSKYKYLLKVKGKGIVSVETLWWTKEGDMSTPHRTFSIKEVSIDNNKEYKTISGEDTAPKNAAEAYIRIIVRKGTVTVSAPRVSKR